MSIRVFEVDFNDLAQLDEKDCVIAHITAESAGVKKGDRVVVNDEAEGLTLPGSVVKLTGEKVFIYCDWFDGLA